MEMFKPPTSDPVIGESNEEVSPPQVQAQVETEAPTKVLSPREELCQKIGCVEKKNGELWILDPEMKEKARALVAKFTDELGHVDLRHVVFVRVLGVSSTKWFGKCNYLGVANKMVAPYIVTEMLKSQYVGHVPEENLIDLLDIRYVITLNENAILLASVGKDVQSEMEAITIFHELLHIKPNMDGLVPHNIQDFSMVLDKFGVHWTSGQFQMDLETRLDAALTQNSE